MRAVDLSSHRDARILNELDDAYWAKNALHSDVQLAAGERVMKRVCEPRSESERIMLVDGLGFCTDALCNMGRTGEARQLASDTLGLIRLHDDGPGSLIAKPQTLAGYRAVRVYASTVELDGNPDEAMRWLTATHKRLAQESGFGDASIDALHILRGVLSAAKRDGSRVAQHFADLARRDGDRLIDKVAEAAPAAAATYLHRAALERRIRGGPAACAEALDLLEASLPLRPNTPRDLQSRGMATGEVAVLSGARDAGARIMSQTVVAFKGVLPRHYESALQQLCERELFVAA